MKTRLLILVAVLAILGVSIGVALASHSQSLEVRVAARSTDDGRIEFGIQQKMPDGTWSEERFPRARFLGERQMDGRWKRSSPIEVEVLIPHPTPTAVPTPPAMTEDSVFNLVRDSVVYVEVPQYENGVATGFVSYGTGFAVTVDGSYTYVLTAAHVMTYDYESEVKVFSSDCLQETHPGNCGVSASIIGLNDQFDVAVLKVQEIFPTIHLTHYRPKADELVVAVGILASTEQRMARSSAGEFVGSKVYSQDSGAARFVEHTARVYPGYSGGPLVAGNGDVIAMTTGVSRVLADRSTAIAYSEICDLVEAWAKYECVDPEEAPERSDPVSTEPVAYVHLSSGQLDYMHVKIDLEFDSIDGPIQVFVDGAREITYGRIYADDGPISVTELGPQTPHGDVVRVSVQSDQGDMRCSKNEKTSTQAESVFDCFWR